uniref:Chromosome partition protein Smc n=1 Tax=Ciona savignyi TaxID=51511 RepID=H2YRR6_CIOSA
MDIDGLKQAWQNEKLALLDAIQALKELLTQTASEAAQQSDDEGSLKWRSDLLKAVAELFEREKRALLAELRANVIEAQNDAENAGENGAASRLETLERRIRNQADNHRSELERLLAADRDQLMEEVKQLKEDRKELNSKAQSRTQELQEQLKTVEDQSRHTQSKLQREVERLSFQLQHEQAMIDDLQSSLDAEQQRSNELLPTLERERDRIVELSAEIESLSSKARSDTMAANQHVQSLQNDLREAKTALERSENE